MQVSTFVTVAQRRRLTIDDALLPLMGPLFAIETHMTMEERVLLGTTALSLPEGFVACEIGSYLGASSCFLAAAASLRRGLIHCVDTWDNRAMAPELPRETYAEFLQNTEQFRSYIIAHRGEAAALAQKIPDRLDLLFLDGDHSYSAVKSDLDLYAPKLTPGGYLLLHDSTEPGVAEALREYLLAHPCDNIDTTQSLVRLRAQ